MKIIVVLHSAVVRILECVGELQVNVSTVRIHIGIARH